jgi:hypothetical protein
MSAFKSNNARLNERLRGEPGLPLLLSLFLLSERPQMQTITILFLSTNTFLLSRVAADLSVIEFFSAAFCCRGTSDYMLALMG